MTSSSWSGWLAAKLAVVSVRQETIVLVNVVSHLYGSTHVYLR